MPLFPITLRLKPPDAISLSFCWRRQVITRRHAFVASSRAFHHATLRQPRLSRFSVSMPSRFTFVISFSAALPRHAATRFSRSPSYSSATLFAISPAFDAPPLSRLTSPRCSPPERRRHAASASRETNIRHSVFRQIILSFLRFIVTFSAFQLWLFSADAAFDSRRCPERHAPRRRYFIAAALPLLLPFSSRQSARRLRCRCRAARSKSEAECVDSPSRFEFFFQDMLVFAQFRDFSAFRLLVFTGFLTPLSSYAMLIVYIIFFMTHCYFSLATRHCLHSAFLLHISPPIFQASEFSLLPSESRLRFSFSATAPSFLLHHRLHHD